jgi:hypothetical protein
MADHRYLSRSLVAGLCAAAAIAAPTAGAEPSDGNGNGYNGAPTIVSGGPMPTMNGVPCFAGHFGTCVGFAQNQPPRTQPRSTMGHSPTVGP